MQDHDRQQFHEQFVAFQGSLFGYIVSLVTHRADAEEIFSRVSLTLWEKWDRFDASRHFLPWARAIAFNEVRNYRRARSRSHVDLSHELVDQLASTREKHDALFERRVSALKECLAGMQDEERQLLESCYASGRSIKEIATEMSTTPGALYMRLHRIRQFLHECIDYRLAEEASG